MSDLFNNPEPPKSEKKNFYKGKQGKFTSKDAAHIYEVEKERDKYKVSSLFYKRQTERLSLEVLQEKKRADMLQAQINLLTKKGN